METLDPPAAAVPSVPGYGTSRLLGQGSTSTVWLVTRSSDDARFALKCPRPGARMEASGILEEVMREVGHLSALKHQHLIQVHDVVPLEGGSAGSLGIVMDYAPGGSLANLIAGRGRLHVGETVTILTPLAQALAYLHAQGTVHGDVAPGNILFTADGKPLLADLGIASMVGGDQPNLEAGTPGFMAPDGTSAGEGAGTTRELQPHRDVYSLAAVGWYCLTGAAPETTLHRPPLSVMVPDVPASLVAALEAALDVDPLLRPTAREMAMAIFRSAAPEPVDLSGAVHSSVIPDLLTRRQALGRPVYRKPRWGGWWRRLVPFGLQRGLSTDSRGPRRRVRWFRSGAFIVATGVLLGVAAWILWSQNPQQQSAEFPAQPQQAAAEAGGLVPKPGTASSGELPKVLAEGLHAEDPAVAVASMSSVRDVALGQGKLDLLDVVNAPGSPAEASDKLLADHLRKAGTVYAGFSTTISVISVSGSPEAGDAVVTVTASTSSYVENGSGANDASNAQAQPQPPGPPRDLSVHVMRADGRWWIVEILPADSGPPTTG
ncbi:serine/threonine protein kinase [Paenarthrobacter sp. CM16]|uniref:serine/threonine-protein kinase n=1 Tax=Paenarthrobacter sp. CM16 TaxID=2738447 RepID=UPI0015580DEA|nr:serine/threonine-protein kinase [Paenarthrobacter sp. CM16]NQD87400.1 serine/threonine protein kinase [Paenarthrobacter sp. CM16]